MHVLFPETGHDFSQLEKYRKDMKRLGQQTGKRVDESWGIVSWLGAQTWQLFEFNIGFGACPCCWLGHLA